MRAGRRYKIKLLTCSVVVAFVARECLLGRHSSRASITFPNYYPHAAQQHADAFHRALSTLAHDHVPLPPLRRIIVRERIGLKWDWYPEKYWEEHVLPRLRENVTIVDVGANVGQFTIPNAKLGHYVFAFEPNDETCAILHDRLAQHGLSHKVSLLASFQILCDSIQTFL